MKRLFRSAFAAAALSAAMIAAQPASAQTPPAGAIVLDPNVVIDVSMTHIETALDRAMAARCCALCPGERCWVRPGTWGACPYCLCDNSCHRHCVAAAVEPEGATEVMIP